LTSAITVAIEGTPDIVDLLGVQAV
jgi:hypothetical protein